VSEVDRTEIRRLIESYAGYADARQPDELAALFAEDGELLVWLDPAVEEPSVRQGRAAIAEAIRFLSRFRHTQHVIANSVIDLGPDATTARAETHCTAHHLSGEGAEATDWTVYLRYSDDFTRAGGQWLIARRELRTMWTTTTSVGDA
jgi:ketosteroid isomerase-like protein